MAAKDSEKKKAGAAGVPAAEQKPQIVRDARGRFVKGTPSPNPMGRPKTSVELRELFREYTHVALRALVEAAKYGKQRERVQAAAIILDRAWGRPPQAITGPDGGPISIDWRGWIAAVMGLPEEDKEKGKTWDGESIETQEDNADA